MCSVCHPVPGVQGPGVLHQRRGALPHLSEVELCSRGGCGVGPLVLWESSVMTDCIWWINQACFENFISDLFSEFVLGFSFECEARLNGPIYPSI